MSDLPAIIASTAGKIELESIEDGREEQVVERLLMNAVARTFNRYFEVQQFEPLIQRFRGGLKVDVGELMPSAHYVKLMRELDGMLEGVARLGAYDSPASIASAVEFILEGLHVNKRLNKEKLSGKVVYRS
jgi:magnesium chelatase subunit I